MRKLKNIEQNVYKRNVIKYHSRLMHANSNNFFINQYTINMTESVLQLIAPLQRQQVLELSIFFPDASVWQLDQNFIPSPKWDCIKHGVFLSRGIVTNSINKCNYHQAQITRQVITQCMLPVSLAFLYWSHQANPSWYWLYWFNRTSIAVMIMLFKCYVNLSG